MKMTDQGYMAEGDREQLEKLRRAAAGLEAQRAVLGDAIVEPALQSLQEKIVALEAGMATSAGVQAQAAEERRIVTILFTDIVGSTSLAEKLDPEEWREVVSAVHGMAGQAIVQHQGKVLQYLGDGLLAVFGAETPSELDPENTVRAALDIQRNIAALQVQHPLQMRVGIHTGLVLLGDLNLPARRELTATGDAMNLAARLQGAAPAGGILVSADTYRYVRGVFDVIPQSPIVLKGKNEPVLTYLVQGARPTRFRIVNRGVAGLETRTVGRQDELERIRGAYEAAMAGRGVRWLQLVGLPGIGKSRLVAEARSMVEAQDYLTPLLKARAQQGDEKQAYALIRRLWFDRFQIAEDTPLLEAQARWVRGVHALMSAGAALFEATKPDIDEISLALGLLMGLAHDDKANLEPAQVRGRAYVVSRQLLSTLRSTGVVVVLLEDLHWADSASWDYLVEVLLREEQRLEAGRHGLLILATARPEWSPPEALLKHPGYTPIQLQALPVESCLELVLELMGRVEGMPQEVFHSLVQRSEGVPYYLEELVNWLLERGVINQESQPWRFIPERWQGALLPDTLQHLLLTRLSSAPQAEQAALKRGAVYGRHFWEGGLEAMGVPGCHDLLERSQERGFVLSQPESAFQGEEEWGFYHNLLRDTAYESLLKRERKDLHGAAANWLEAQASQAGRLDEMASLLGEHYDRAGMAGQAVRWYLLAGQHAKERGATVEARRLLDRALDLIPPDDGETRWNTLLLRCELQGVLGDIPARQADSAALLALAETLGDDKRLAEAYYRLGYSLSLAGDEGQALLAYEKAVALARRTESPELEALAQSLTSISQTSLGNGAAASEAATIALNLLLSCSDPTACAMVMTNLAYHYGLSGDLSQAVKIQQQQVEILRHSSNLYGETIGLLNLGYYDVLLGMYAQGASVLEQALQRAEAISSRQNINLARLNLSLAYWRMGRSQDAQNLLNQVGLDLTADSDTFYRAICASYLGLVFEFSGDVDAASRHFGQASDELRTLNMKGYLHDALAGLARCAIALGSLEEAGHSVAEIWDYLCNEKGYGMEFPQMAYLTCAGVFTSLGDQEKAHQAILQAYQDISERAARISDIEWRRSFLENVPENRKLLEALAQLTQG
jgi:class 3 adenylate cyclase/tetratricopeptide (TPR) repeat protein